MWPSRKKLLIANSKAGSQNYSRLSTFKSEQVMRCRVTCGDAATGDEGGAWQCQSLLPTSHANLRWAALLAVRSVVICSAKSGHTCEHAMRPKATLIAAQVQTVQLKKVQCPFFSVLLQVCFRQLTDTS